MICDTDRMEHEIINIVDQQAEMMKLLKLAEQEIVELKEKVRKLEISVASN